MVASDRGVQWGRQWVSLLRRRESDSGPREEINTWTTTRDQWSGASLGGRGEAKVNGRGVVVHKTFPYAHRLDQ